ncbi:glycosyltransferase family protein [Arthrobacter sp. TMN-50]
MPEVIPPTGRPRVLVLSFSRIDRDPRVLRQIRFLGEFAEIHTCGYGSAPESVAGHIEIPDEYERWRPQPKKTGLLLAARLHRRLYFNSAKVKFVQDRIPTGTFDVVIANDVIAAPLALALKPLKGVHADLHEYAPRQGEDVRSWRLLFGPFMDWASRDYVTKVDSATTVAKGIAEEYARVYGIPEPAVVPNASAYHMGLTPTAVGTPLRLIHAGVAGRGRKIEIMIDAIARANRRKPGTATLDLVLVPGEQRYIDELTLAANSVEDGAVRVIPPVSFREIVPLLHDYDVGFYLCPPNNFNMLHALPNKLFEFIQARLAIVIGPSPEMERVVREHDLGIVAAGFDAESAADVLVSLTSEQVAAMKQASHLAADSLSADRVSIVWVDAVKKLLGAA